MDQIGKMQCNVCGKVLKIENGILKEDCLTVEKEWGYFSNKDLELHQFCMCEKCYDTMIHNFIISVKTLEQENVFHEV